MITSYIDKLAYLHIAKRKVLGIKHYNKDTWYIPSGVRADNETDTEALQKTVAEGLGTVLISDSITYFDTYTAPALDHPEGVHIRMKCYTAEYMGKLKPCGGVSRLGWFAYSDKDLVSPIACVILEDIKAKGLID